MPPVEARIGEIAGAQDNVIGLAQLLDAGVSRKVLGARLRSGSWRRLHRSVFLVGPAPPSFAACARAAAMWIGEGACVGFEAATVLLKLRPEPAGDPGPIDILVDGRNPGVRPGIVLHRTTIVDDEIGYVRGIPVSSPARTICDLAGRWPMSEVEQLLIDARRARIVTDTKLHAVLDRVPARGGHSAMRALLADETEDGYSRSAAERRLRGLLRETGLPAPVYNRKVSGLMVDAHWPALRVVVEVDGRRDHATPWAFENDRRRDQILAAAGYVVIRVTWRQLVQQPTAVAVRIAQALVWGQRAA